jgi:hypothetical protein
VYSVPNFNDDGSPQPPTIKYEAWTAIDATGTVAQYNSQSTYDAFINTPPPNRPLTKIEIDIARLNSDLSNACELRRDEVRNRLLKLLNAKCYLIGGCKLPSTDLTAGTEAFFNNDRVVPERDIDMMVDEMIKQCRIRGWVTTYRRISLGCRDILTAPYAKVIRQTGYISPFRFLPKGERLVPNTWNLGYVDRFGQKQAIDQVFYGVANRDGLTETNKAVLFKRDKVDQKIKSFIKTSTILTTKAPDGITDLDILDIDPEVDEIPAKPGKSEEEKNNPNYRLLFPNCEINKRRQVVEQTILLDINKNFCNPATPNQADIKQLEQSANADCPVLTDDNTAPDPDRPKAVPTSTEILDIEYKIDRDKDGKKILTKTVTSTQKRPQDRK